MGPTGRNLGRLPAISRKALAIALVAGSTASALAPVDRAFAQEVSGETRQSFSIPAGDLAAALRAFADQTGLQMVFSTTAVEDKRTEGANGELSRTEALARILAGSGLSYRISDNRTVTIEAAAGADGERVLGAVRVQGAQNGHFGRAGQAAGVNGINGSRDITATEGTGSFTSGALTIGSKVPQAIKDVPQSVSVITAQRLEEQNITDFNSAMRELPGVTTVQGGTSNEYIFYSRGFEITSISIDGGAPLNTRFGNSTTRTAYFPQVDMAQYDHVELLRGAAGSFNGYGDPSGTINLVRKKPLDHAQFVLVAQAGSWDNYRVMADATSPLAIGGRLRGRLVLLYEDRNYFYDIATDNKALVYGIAELDVTPSTLATAGISYTRQDSVPWHRGLPRYQTGADLELLRSTCLCFPWNRWDFDTTELFAGIEQRIGAEWTAKLNLTHNRQSSTQNVGSSSGAVNPLTGKGPRLFTNATADYSSRQFSAEATLTGAFDIFGQRQEITIGANRVDSDGGGLTAYPTLVSGTLAQPYQPYPGGPTYYSGSPNGSTPPIDVFHFDPFDPLYTEPRKALPISRTIESGQVQYVAYANLRLTAFDRLHLMTGLRWSRYRTQLASVNLCTSIPTSGDPASNNCVGREIGDPYDPRRSSFGGNDISWPPSVSLSYDITNALTAYVGYTDIYQNQASYLDADLNPIGPVTGSNIEAGLKWEVLDGRLNVSIAGYRIRQKGFATQDLSEELYDFGVTPEDLANGIEFYVIANDGSRIPNGMVDAERSCCFMSNPDRTLESDGVDIDLTGQVLSGWQVAANYTYNRNVQEGSYFGTGDGFPVVSIQPEHLYKLWTSYDFGAAGETGWLSGLTLSGGVDGQSSGYRSGTVCTDVNPPNALGVSTCKSGATVPFSFTVLPYAVLSGRIDYRFTRIWSLAVNVENVLDKTYYKAAGSVTSGNWYGSPRAFTLSLRGKW